MKTLIIHPKDKSTQFLDIVYKNIENKTVVTGGINKVDLKKLIDSHDRVMMMGHGSPSGLFSVGQFKDSNGFIIDESIVHNLKQKENNVYIWCHANRFVDHFKLKGFYSGMFISEVGEAFYCGLRETTQKIVDESNYGFCEIFSKYADKPKEIIYENVMKEYGLIADSNPVATYNHQRLYKA
jgi:hypothetical protein